MSDMMRQLANLSENLLAVGARLVSLKDTLFICCAFKIMR
jgi:hypothetical protein